MDDAIELPFKVYTFWNEGDKPEIRRFGVIKGACESFFYLIQKLLEVYPGLKDKDYTVTWKDEDGDDVVISSDLELMTALRFTNYGYLKLYVTCKGAAKTEDCGAFCPGTSTHANSARMQGAMSGLHYGVVCDSCENAVIGFRYKCTVCEDFDLCSQCEAAGVHPEHCMVRVPTPTMPRSLIKAAIKRSRSFLKTVASNIPEECPYTKRRRDKSGERRHRGHHSGHHGGHGGEHHRRARSGWLDTFTTYMNEFANLAGDIDLNVDPPAPANQPENKPEASQEKATNTNGATQAPNQPGQSTSGNAAAPAQCPFPRGVNVQDLIANLMQDLRRASLMPEPSDAEMGQGDRKAPQPETAPAQAEVPIKTEVPANTEASAQSEAQSNASMKSFTSVKSDYSEKSASSGTSNTSRASSLAPDQFKDVSPERADDWTVINKEKDLMDASIPNEGPTPIGFNLPAEFQERVKISEGGLYPPLNTSTAVLNPKVPDTIPGAAPTAPEPEGAAAAPPQQPRVSPQPQQVPQPPRPQPMPQPRQRHPRPHIDAAIEQMLAMGFTNEGNWLTQLLESKDGNIAAVLDLLTPVNPKGK